MWSTENPQCGVFGTHMYKAMDYIMNDNRPDIKIDIEGTGAILYTLHSKV